LKHWDKVLILNKKGEILDNLLCKKVQEITKTLISTGSTGSYSKLLKTDHEKKLFEQNLITIDCDSESYLYNFETLKKFPDEN